MITVVNKYKHIPTNQDFFIGRGSAFGNPYVIGSEYTRDEAVDKYKLFINDKKQHNAQFRHELQKLADKAKISDINLVCYCKPQRCHGDVLKEILEKEYL